MVTLRTQLWNPNDKWDERRARLVSEDRLLNFEGPPKTKPSSRANEHDDTNLICIVIECFAKRRAALGDIGKPRIRRPVRASTQEHRRTRSEKITTLHILTR